VGTDQEYPHDLLLLLRPLPQVHQKLIDAHLTPPTGGPPLVREEQVSFPASNRRARVESSSSIPPRRAWASSPAAGSVERPHGTLSLSNGIRGAALSWREGG
jgi:hypothetical protein